MPNGIMTNVCYLSIDVICILKPVDLETALCPVSSLYQISPKCNYTQIKTRCTGLYRSLHPHGLSHLVRD